MNKHTTKCPIKSTNTVISQLTVNWIDDTERRDNHTVLYEIFQAVWEEGFVKLICTGSKYRNGLGISQATDSVIITSFR